MKQCLFSGNLSSEHLSEFRHDRLEIWTEGALNKKSSEEYTHSTEQENKRWEMIKKQKEVAVPSRTRTTTRERDVERTRPIVSQFDIRKSHKC